MRDQYGFMKFEAQVLSKVPTNVPYMKDFMKDRQAMFKKAIAEKSSKAEYQRRVANLYQGNRWLKKTKIGRIVADPWRALRDYEDRWRDKMPAYESPWERRYRGFRAYTAQVDADLKRRSYLQ